MDRTACIAPEPRHRTAVLLPNRTFGSGWFCSVLLHVYILVARRGQLLHIRGAGIVIGRGAPVIPVDTWTGGEEKEERKEEKREFCVQSSLESKGTKVLCARSAGAPADGRDGWTPAFNPKSGREEFTQIQEKSSGHEELILLNIWVLDSDFANGNCSKFDSNTLFTCQSYITPLKAPARFRAPCATPASLQDDPRQCGYLRDQICTLCYQCICGLVSNNLPISPAI